MSDMPIVSPFVPWVPTPNRKRRHVLDLDDFSAAEIIDVLDAATSMKEVLGRSVPQVPILRGRTVVNVFYEESTRTRMSFELAARTLSASGLTLQRLRKFEQNRRWGCVQQRKGGNAFS